MMHGIQVEDAEMVGAVGFYMLARSHRNDLEMFEFMAETADRSILVFGATSGLVSNVDKLSWKIKAVVAHEEREKIARRQMFDLYKAGTYSFRSVADHLNRLGIKPNRGPGKENHNRKRAVIFTGDVIKDIIHNPSYIGKIDLGGQLIDGQFPALVDEATWHACKEVSSRNRRHANPT